MTTLKITCDDDSNPDDKNDGGSDPNDKNDDGSSPDDKNDDGSDPEDKNDVDGDSWVDEWNSDEHTDPTEIFGAFDSWLSSNIGNYSSGPINMFGACCSPNLARRLSSTSTTL